MGLAFDYIVTKNLETESDYPYKAADGTCKFVASKAKVGDKGHTNVAANSVAQLKAAVAEGPVSVAIEADTYVF